LSVTLFACFTGVPAIVCGHIARGRIARAGGTLGGRGQATTGLVLGYLSLVGTLLVGVGAYFVAKQAPAIQSGSAPALVTAQAASLTTAVERYRADKGKLPPLAVSNGEQVDTRVFSAILASGGYYNPTQNGFAMNNVPSDLWLQPLNIAVDVNGDGTVEVGTEKVQGTVAVWSSGPNKHDESGGGDDIRSW
jgi:hypothetical protein